MWAFLVFGLGLRRGYVSDKPEGIFVKGIALVPKPGMLSLHHGTRAQLAGVLTRRRDFSRMSAFERR
jgi:hypothetical protein